MIVFPVPGGRSLLLEVAAESLQTTFAAFWPRPPRDELVLAIALAATALLAVFYIRL
jgi:hypothetical protein